MGHQITSRVTESPEFHIHEGKTSSHEGESHKINLQIAENNSSLYQYEDHNHAYLKMQQQHSTNDRKQFSELWHIDHQTKVKDNETAHF